jgi:Dolichyl-phosphate-mannose-protein mannosyltransferase
MLHIQSIGLRRLGQYAVHQSIALPLVTLLVIIALLISPVGEFPLNDDWIYAKTVQHLLQTGQYQAHPYLNATLVVQTYWGALFCQLFGFSFTTLRCSTLVLSGLNAWGVAQCALALRLPRALALLCGIIVMTNPLMLGLSYSFMTDIPFLTLSTLSGLCFLRALRRFSPVLIGCGSVLGVAAFFVRQFGILVPVAFALTLGILQLRRQIKLPRTTWLALVSPWGIGAILYCGFAQILQSETPILESAGDRLWVVLMDGFRYLPIALSYMGLFSLPLGIVVLWQLWRKRGDWSRRQWLIWAGFCASALALFFLPQILYLVIQLLEEKKTVWLHQYPYRMPLLDLGILLDFGLGHAQLPNPIPRPALQIHDGWWIVTLPSVAMGGLLFTKAWDQICLWRGQTFTQISLERQTQELFLWLWAAVALLSAYNPWRAIITDRYLLMAFVPFMLILAMEFRKISAAVALRGATCVTSMGLILSLMLLQDYMAWNRAASIAQNRLMTGYQIPAAAIAGTDPLNGWYNGDAYMKRHNTRSWWDLNIGRKGPWVLDNQYTIASVEPRPGYQVLERIPYFSWLGWKERFIVIFKRVSSEAKNKP